MSFHHKDQFANPSRPVSHRQLKVGEAIRHILANLFLQAELPMPGLPVSVTITQVKMSPDLQNATVYIMPLGGQFREETLAYLIEVAGYIRYQLGKELHLKFTPALRFRLDESFEKAQRIDELLKR
jgi:ribosome-binding factor A